MKLLIITQTLDKNDPILGFFHRWVEEFARQCERVHVMALNVGEYALPENVTVHPLGKSEGKGRLTQLARLWRISWRVRRDYDAVFAHMNPEYVLYGWLLWRALGKRIGLWYTHGKVSWRLHLAVSVAHVVLTASPESCRIDSHKRHIVGHGIDTDVLTVRTRNPSDEVFRIVSISRITPSKQLELLIDAVESLTLERPLLLHFIGAPATPQDEIYAQRLRARAAKSPVVGYEGGVPHEDVAAWLGHADVFVNLSTTGSVDKAVLEAMARGVPVVTTNNAFDELFENVGILHIVDANPREIAQEITSIAELPYDVRMQQAQNLHKAIATQFGLPETVARISATLFH